MDRDVEALKSVNRSGFPFQLRLEHEVTSSQATHRWRVEAREQPWTRGGEGGLGFIDLVLRHSDKYVSMVVECKRQKGDDARQLTWTFLVPDEARGDVELASAYFAAAGQMKTEEDGDELRWEEMRAWEDIRLAPASTQSEFCVLVGEDPRRAPLLEAICAGLLESTEGLGDEEIRVAAAQDPVGRHRAYYVPVIVTNARLLTCRFRSADVSAVDGTLDPEHCSFEDVPYVRFRKTLATSFPEGSFSSLRATNSARERCVFVVNSGSFVSFLQSWSIDRAYESAIPYAKIWHQRFFRGLGIS